MKSAPRQHLSAHLGNGGVSRGTGHDPQRLWARAARGGRSVLIALAGKTVRGTSGTEHPRGEPLLGADLPEEGMVLLQVAAGAQENESSVAPTLLPALDRRGKVVLGDARPPNGRCPSRFATRAGTTGWGIENGLHHWRDVTFHEDRTRLTRGNAGRVMAILNNLVIGLLRFTGATNLAHERRTNATDVPAIIRLLVTSPQRL